MRDDFCVFILTHGRPDRVFTYDTLNKVGYTGKVYIVIDDEDKTEAEYRRRFEDKVLQFSKSEIAKTFDEGDNFQDRRAIIYARNACWDLAKQVGCRYFIQLDDDYLRFRYRIDNNGDYTTVNDVLDLNAILSKFVEFLESTNIASLAFGQGGDYIGGKNGSMWSKNRARKCMNTFICDAERSFLFQGRINEDVNTYVGKGRMGLVFLTHFGVGIEQLVTQTNAGGMTDLYIESGTYIKSFYTVMYAPSCTKIRQMQNKHGRLHHSINWDAAVPKIIREEYRK